MAKLALITGASGGLAAALADGLEADGWSLALVSRSTGSLAEKDGRMVIRADVRDPEEVARVFDALLERFPEPPQALAHCAGNTLIAPMARTRPEQYREIMAANLDSAFYCLQSFCTRLAQAHLPGAAVLVSSVVARIGVSSHAAIAAAKAGVEGLVRSAAADYAASGIRINAIAPGLMESPMTARMVASERGREQAAGQYPLGRFGQPGDGAAALRWLLSEQSSWITGQILPVDGGFTAIRPMVRK